ncbi:MAG: hypothetical protein HY815_01895 [Candidatus Riflebacteria bacterium]|nr:hypothetical protein [Candidatus Riflebacteria bacterium]
MDSTPSRNGPGAAPLRAGVSKPIKGRADRNRCPVCDGLVAAPASWCCDCDTPHHPDCYSSNGHCGVPGCLGVRIKAGPGKVAGASWIDGKDAAGEIVPQSRIVDFLSIREVLVRFLCIFFGTAIPMGALSSPFVREAIPLWLFNTLVLPVAALSMFGAWRFARTVVEDYWVIDGKSRTIWLHRRTFGQVRLEAEAPFSSILKVELTAAKSEMFGPYRHYLSLVLTGNRRIGVLTGTDATEDEQAPRHVLDAASRLSRIVGLPIVRGAPVAPFSWGVSRGR